jgi:hypothetical protein
VNHNTAYQIHGNASANGMEIVLMQQSAKARMTIANSSFTDVTGDILEGVNFGTNQTLELELVNVIASHAAPPAGVPGFDVEVQTNPTNRGSCLLLYNTGPNFLPASDNSMSVTVRDSTFTDCEVGIGIASRRSQRVLSIDIESSMVTGNRRANLWIKNADPVAASTSPATTSTSSLLAVQGGPSPGILGRLAVRVRRSNLAGATSGPNIYAYAVPGTVLSGLIDLGNDGPELGSAGLNDLSGRPPIVRLAGLTMLARGNWWGQASGPTPALAVLLNDATLKGDAPLRSPPRRWDPHFGRGSVNEGDWAWNRTPPRFL